MNSGRKSRRCSRTAQLYYLYLLLVSFALITVAQTNEDNDDLVPNIEPSEVDIQAKTQTVTDTITETQIREQTPELPVVISSDTQTDEQTQSPASGTLEVDPTLEEALGTSSEYDGLLQPSFTESSTSVQGTSEQATMETAGTTQSVYTDQSEEPVPYEPVEKQVEEVIDKSVPIVTEQTKQEDSQEKEKEIPHEVLEEPGEKDRLSDVKPEPFREEVADSVPVPKEEETPTVIEMPGPVDIEADDKTVKAEEEGLTFNEWAQKVLAEEEKEKHHAKTDTVAVTSTKQRKKKNYALQECGAKILASNPEGTNVKSVLNPNKDDYMINPCKVKKWFVLELCEPMQAVNVEMASFELFSSQPKSFKVFLSDRYPTKDWKLAVQDEMTEERAVQSFNVEDAEGYFAKFVRVELLDHYSNEHFCPLTLFRLFGIAVVDYDISEGDDEDHDEQEQEDDDIVTEEEEEGDTKNLFSSAKDTVLKIVKKVLNVEDKKDEEQQQLNETADNFNQTVSIEETKVMNISADSQTLPCPPDARIPGTGESKPPVVGDPQPQPLYPETTNDVTLVTKIEDHEQIETGEEPFLTDKRDSAKLLQENIKKCFACSNHTQKLSFAHSFPVTQLCVYLKILLDKYRGQSCPVPVHTVKTEAEQKNGEMNVEASLVSSTVTASQSIHSDSDSLVKEIETQSNVVKSSVISRDVSDLTSESSVKTLAGNSGILIDQSNTLVAVDMETSTVIEILPEHTKVIQESSTVEFQTRETIIPTPTQTVLHEKSDIYDSSIKSSTSVIVDNGPESTVIDSALDKIEPSPSVVTESKESDLLSPSSREPTPVILGTESQTLKMVEPTAVPPSEKGTAFPETASVVDKIVATESSAVDPTASVAIEPAYLDQQEKPTPITQDQEAPSVKPLPLTDEVQAVDQGLDKKEEILDVKPIEDGAKQKGLGLVKVPLVPFTKRESAIMRLNNRIKVLEQNVSLSSRFLEELSKRYKKQSEDMMKMLNKTVARLNNVTLEAEIKDKLHDDAISIMESRIENMTAIVTELTVKLDKLNKQVTDRQMIWTSIEIIILMIIMIILVRRGKTTVSVPEIKEKPVATPVRRVRPTFRRNSLSGPATPSKCKSDLDPGPSLQRFSSETMLVNCDYPVIEPGKTPLFTPQPKEVMKKKKKKKNKNPESKYHAGLKGSNSEQAMEKGNNSILLPGSSINSAGVLFRGENNEKPETSLEKTGLLTCEKHFVDSTRSERSNSSVSCSSSGTSVGSSEISVCDRNAPGIFQGGLGKKPGKLSSISQGPTTNAGGNTGGHKKAKTSPTLHRNDKSIIKTHKRQKSLPLNSNIYSLPLIENVGSIESNVSHDNLSSNRLIDKTTSKGKSAGVRKSLSMTAATRRSKHDNLIQETGKYEDLFKPEKGSFHQSGANTNSNATGNVPVKNKFNSFDHKMYDNAKRTFKTSVHERHGVDTGTFSGLSVKGSKSCCNIDPGGSVNSPQFNGYAVNGHDYMNANGHDCKYGPTVQNDNCSDLQNKDNTDISNSKSGWRKMIGWF